MTQQRRIRFRTTESPHPARTAALVLGAAGALLLLSVPASAVTTLPTPSTSTSATDSATPNTSTGVSSPSTADPSSTQSYAAATTPAPTAATGTVSGRILDDVTGAPVVAAWVHLIRWDGHIYVDGTPRGILTGCGGRYAIEGSPGDWRLQVLASDPEQEFGYVQRTLEDETPMSTAPTVRLVEGTRVELDVRMQPGGKVSGIVLQSDGSVAPGATLEVRSGPGLRDLGSYGLAPASEPDGTFSLAISYAVPTTAVVRASWSYDGAQSWLFAQSDPFTIGPEQVLTGVRVVLPEQPKPTPTPSAGDDSQEQGGAGGLPTTGWPMATGAVLGGLSLVLGLVLVASTRRRSFHL